MDFIKAKAIGITTPTVDFIPDSEGIISYCARVSNESNQCNWATADKLLSYCFREGHVSVFETVSIVMEIEVPRDISRQVLRHRSFSFQELSGRYAKMESFAIRECRMQDTKNRQNSIESNDAETSKWWISNQQLLIDRTNELYNEALSRGIAKEQARAILPEGNTMSRMYMNGSVRSWLHYCDVRQDPSTQKEHRILANKVADEIKQLLPSLAEYFDKKETKE